jgi:hypothetical protein
MTDTTQAWAEVQVAEVYWLQWDDARRAHPYDLHRTDARSFKLARPLQPMKERRLVADNDKIEVHEGRRAGVVVSVRLKPDEADLLEGLAQRDGRTLSETLRVGLHCLANRPVPSRSIGLHGELASLTRGEWDEATLEPA